MPKERGYQKKKYVGHPKAAGRRSYIMDKEKRKM